MQIFDEMICKNKTLFIKIYRISNVKHNAKESLNKMEKIMK